MHVYEKKPIFSQYGNNNIEIIWNYWTFPNFTFLPSIKQIFITYTIVFDKLVCFEKKKYTLKNYVFIVKTVEFLS